MLRLCSLAHPSFGARASHVIAGSDRFYQKVANSDTLDLRSLLPDESAKCFAVGPFGAELIDIRFDRD